MATATDARRAVPDGRRGSTTVTGTTTLVRFMLRRDRIKLPLWIAGLALFVLYVGSAVPQIAANEQELAATALLFESPVARMWVGPGYGMDEVTYERFFAAGYALYLYILGALMNILLVSRHTRGEEQSGRAELIRASVVGRHAPLTAALVVAALTNLIAGAAAAAMAIGVGFAVPGSVLIGVTLALVGLSFAALTAVTVQLTESSRAASGIAGAALGVSFLVRGLGDMLSAGGSTLSWFSPLGWSLQTGPYVMNRWWPLLLFLGLTVVLVIAAYALQARRDFGAGLWPAGRGRSHARATLGTPFGLARRLQRGALIGWGVAIALFALVDGAFAQAMLDAASDMPPMLTDMFGGAEGLAEGYVAFLAEYSGYLAVAYTVFAAQSLLTEEHLGRAEAILATPTSRTAWAGSHYAVIAVNLTVIMATAGLLAGVAYGGVTGDWAVLGTLVAAHLNLLPAIWVILGVMALLFGWLPRLMVVIGWVLAGLVFFLGLFARLTNLPEWVYRLSPLSHPAQIPVEEFSLTPLLVLTVIAVAAVVLGLTGLRRRQIVNKG